MPFCPKCGNEVSDGAAFCRECGNKIKNTTKENKYFQKVVNFDFKKVLSFLKKYFLNFYVDYNSKLFKFAMIIFLAIGIGHPIYRAVDRLLPLTIYELFPGVHTVVNFLICAILFGFFAVPILKIKSKQNVRKSNFLIILWIVAVVLNLLVFLAGNNLYQYVLYSNYATTIIEILLVISTAALIFKNKPKSPIVLIISALSFAFLGSSIWSIKMNINFYKIDKLLGQSGDLLEIFYSLRYIILVVTLFLLIYLIPRKISNWLVCIPTLFVIILEFNKLIDDLRFINIINFIIDVCIIIMFVLFALSCSKKISYDYLIENKNKLRQSVIKVGVISLCSLAIIIFTYLFISAKICGVEINNGIEKWKNQIVNGELNNSTAWDSMNNDIFKYLPTKFSSRFIDEYYLYETLKENKYSMEDISICYTAYKENKVDADIIEKYLYISVDESWEYNSVLSSYYSKYKEMQPRSENVSASAYIDVNKGEIEVTVKNDNVMPISECSVSCNFTIMFVESGSYSNHEYGRGTKSIIIEDIAGGSKKTETISFNPDAYYDSYGSYITAFLWEKSVKITDVN